MLDVLTWLLLKSGVFLIDRQTYINWTFVEGTIVCIRVIKAYSALVSFSSLVGRLIKVLFSWILIKPLEDIITISTDPCSTLSCWDNSWLIMAWLRMVPTLLYLRAREGLLIGFENIIAWIIELIFILFVIEVGLVVSIHPIYWIFIVIAVEGSHLQIFYIGSQCGDYPWVDVVLIAETLCKSHRIIAGSNH